MSNIPEAVMAGLAGNAVYGILNEVVCAGNGLSDYTEANVMKLAGADEELIKLLTHTLSHLSNIRDMAEASDKYFQEYLSKVKEESPLSMQAIGNELKSHELIKKLQEIAGMTLEEVAQAELKAEAKLNGN